MKPPDQAEEQTPPRSGEVATTDGLALARRDIHSLRTVPLRLHHLTRTTSATDHAEKPGHEPLAICYRSHCHRRHRARHTARRPLVHNWTREHPGGGRRGAGSIRRCAAACGVHPRPGEPGAGRGRCVWTAADRPCGGLRGVGLRLRRPVRRVPGTARGRGHARLLGARRHLGAAVAVLVADQAGRAAVGVPGGRGGRGAGRGSEGPRALADDRAGIGDPRRGRLPHGLGLAGAGGLPPARCVPGSSCATDDCCRCSLAMPSPTRPFCSVHHLRSPSPRSFSRWC